MTEWRDFQDGFISGIHGLDPRCCPYPKMSGEWRTWQKWHAWGTEIHNEIERLESMEGEQITTTRVAPAMEVITCEAGHSAVTRPTAICGAG